MPPTTRYERRDVVSDVADKSYERQATPDKQRVMGLEPTTFTLATCEPRVQALKPQGVTDGGAFAYTNAYTESQNPVRPEAAEVVNETGGGDSGRRASDEGDRTAEGAAIPPEDAAVAGADVETNAGPDAATTTGADVETATGAGAQALVDALAMLDRLPLTDAERAEAVRRLLGRPGGPGEVQPELEDSTGPEDTTGREPTGGGADA